MWIRWIRIRIWNGIRNTANYMYYLKFAFAFLEKKPVCKRTKPVPAFHLDFSTLPPAAVENSSPKVDM